MTSPKPTNGEKDDKYYQDLYMKRIQQCGHAGIAGDSVQKEKNIDKHGEEALCKNCGGTGNNLYSMYQQCPDCHGTGLTQITNE